jgi:hypothetical protein
MAYFQILVPAIVFTVIALWKFNLLLSGICMAGWSGFLYYYMNNRPTNVVAGDATDVALIIAYSFMIAAIPLITIIRWRSRNVRDLGSLEGDEKRARRFRQPDVSDMTTDEYKTYLRTRTRRR